jgi:hypothetical protein
MAISGWFLVAASISAPAAGQDARPAQKSAAIDHLTAEQQKQADALAGQFEKSCLNQSIPTSPNTLVNAMSAWARDPAVCSCIGRRLRAAITPSVAAYNTEQGQQFLKHFAENDAAECAVPVVKAHFSASCEQLLGDAFAQIPADKTAQRVKELGYQDLGSLLKGSCSCIRGAIRDITPHDWVSSTLTKYSEYKERQQTGQPTASPASTPLDEALGTCLQTGKH